jgi:hypothetical protein
VAPRILHDIDQGLEVGRIVVRNGRIGHRLHNT